MNRIKRYSAALAALAMALLPALPARAVRNCENFGSIIYLNGVQRADIACFAQTSQPAYMCMLPGYLHDHNVTWAVNTVCSAVTKYAIVDSITAWANALPGVAFQEVTWPGPAELNFRCNSAELEPSIINVNSDDMQFAATGHKISSSLEGYTGPYSTTLWSAGPNGPIGSPPYYEPEFGAYDMAQDIFINQNVIDAEALASTCPGAPGTVFDRQTFLRKWVMRHEMGHALGLQHMSEGFMRGSFGCQHFSESLSGVDSSWSDAILAYAGSDSNSTNSYPDGTGCALEAAQPLSVRNGRAAEIREFARVAYAIDEMPADGRPTVPGGVMSSSEMTAIINTCTSGLSPSVTNGQFEYDPDASFQIQYSDNHTYGIRPGTNHLPCNFATSGQVCAVPPGKMIHWCFDPSLSAADKAILEMDTHAGAFWDDHHICYGTETNILGNDVCSQASGKRARYPVNPLSWHSGECGRPRNVTQYRGFTLVHHSDCTSPETKLVIGKAAIGATNSLNMRGYLSFDATWTPDASNTLTMVNATRWAAKGTYINWGGGSHYATMHIDLDDIWASATTDPYRWLIVLHSIYLGLDWATGLGSRTDNDQKLNSLAVLPMWKNWDPVGHTFDNNYYPSYFGHGGVDDCRQRAFQDITNSALPGKEIHLEGPYCGSEKNQ